MIEFRKIELSDKEWVEKILKKANLKGCEYTFANNYIWGEQYQLEIANVEGFYCSRNGIDELEYSFPIGEGDLLKVIRLLEADAKERGVKLVLKGLLPEHISMLNVLCPDEFEFTNSRDDSDYIYTVEKLSKLAGKKLHGKRNHIARFKDDEDWQYETISDDNMKDCLDMNSRWCEKYKCLESVSLKHEACAVKKAFRHYKELGLRGGLIRKKGEVVAYSVGEPLSDDTFVVHIEKAFADIQGAYPMMNQQFVLHECQEFEYVNREEDLGEEGLRKAKLSYYPDILLDKYRAIQK